MNEESLSSAPKLLAHHAQMLADSGIPPEIIAARGYYTATTKSELQRLGFGLPQRQVPALVLPVYNSQGEVAFHQIRPDQPRLRDGKHVKYETPAGIQMTFDIPPTIRHLLKDPSTPLIVTEGIKKADAAASKGLCCIGLLGVWNFRGKNEFGGKTALAEFEDIALHGRRTYIAFDSDVMQKSEVHAALTRLKAFLESRGAI